MDERMLLEAAPVAVFTRHRRIHTFYSAAAYVLAKQLGNMYLGLEHFNTLSLLPLSTSWTRELCSHVLLLFLVLFFHPAANLHRICT